MLCHQCGPQCLLVKFYFVCHRSNKVFFSKMPEMTLPLKEKCFERASKTYN